ncbi:MAG: sulfite exporter TauE/SafE family protein, partial [Caldisericota bacterium]|nr:sulfite exporter TauE/SafE family protein [Caldisericota bacterium]
MKSKKVYVGGMHCDACSTLIASQFKQVAGVQKVKVNLGAGTAEVFYESKEPQIGDLRSRAEKYGYTVGTSKPATAEPPMSLRKWLAALAIAAAFIGLFYLVQRSGIMSAIGATSDGASYGVAILVGLVASVSTCLAVVGSIVIAFAETYHADNATTSISAAVRPNVLFHAGRIATFAVLGGVLGLVGGELSISGRSLSILTMVVAVVMILLGLNILGLAPSLTRLGIRMPARLTSGLDRMKKSRSPVTPLALGGLTFFLPCGFTQSMQIMALGSGSVVRGALIMGLFALGTLPVLFVAGVTASWTRHRRMAVFQKAAGILVLVFAIYTLSSGARLFGFTGQVTPSGSTPIVTTPDATTPGETQRVEMHVRYSGFEPSVVHVKKGLPVSFVIYGDEVTGCTNRIIIPSLNISKDIGPGENIVTFTPTKTGRIPYSCWM